MAITAVIKHGGRLPELAMEVEFDKFAGKIIGFWQDFPANYVDDFRDGSKKDIDVEYH